MYRITFLKDNYNNNNLTLKSYVVNAGLGKIEDEFRKSLAVARQTQLLQDFSDIMNNLSA